MKKMGLFKAKKLVEMFGLMKIYFGCQSRPERRGLSRAKKYEVTK